MPVSGRMAACPQRVRSCQHGYDRSPLLRALPPVTEGLSRTLLVSAPAFRCAGAIALAAAEAHDDRGGHKGPRDRIGGAVEAVGDALPGARICGQSSGAV